MLITKKSEERDMAGVASVVSDKGQWVSRVFVSDSSPGNLC